MRQQASVQTLVKHLINRKSETKYVSHTCENQTVHNSAITGGDIIPVLPSIPQGTTDYTRLGDSIRPISLKVKGLLSANRNAITDNKVLLARILVLSSKSNKSTTSLPTGVIFNNMFKPNDDTATTVGPFTGDQRQLSWPVNTDAYRVHYDKVVRIAPSSPEGTEEQPASFVRWTAKVTCPAAFDYDNTSAGDFPTNFAPFMAIGYAYADGTGPDTVTPKLVSYANSYLKFKDF